MGWIMDITKFGDFINDIGYSLPNNFNYSIGIGELKKGLKILIKIKIIETYG